MSYLTDIFLRCARILRQHKFVAVFLSSHFLFAFFLGRMFALAPDEGGYLYTFNNIYGSPDINPQLKSGWITSPKPFLWVAYLPAKVLNICGVPDYISIRILSIALSLTALLLLQHLLKHSTSNRKKYSNVIFLFFFIPSIFLWTTVGLRESFILAEVSLVLVGATYLFENQIKRAYLLLVLGSYGLLSTKSYLWVCLALSTFLFAAIFIIQQRHRRKIVNLLVALVLLPCVFFASTTSLYAFEFLVSSIFHSNISATGARSGDSVVLMAIPPSPTHSPESTGPSSSPNLPGLNGLTGSTGPSNSPGLTGSTGPSNSPGTTGSTVPPNSPGTTSPPEVMTFHGDTTLIILHFYLVENPKAIFTKVLNVFGISQRIQKIWEQKVSSGLVKKSIKEAQDTSSLSGYILKPGRISDPVSNVRPALLFLFGPIPFHDHGGIALNIATLESPLWWLLYLIVIIQFIRIRKNKLMSDPILALTLIYFLSVVSFSSLVEVNLGTSFRHRSILLVPLIFLYIRIRSKSNSRPLNPILQK